MVSPLSAKTTHPETDIGTIREAASTLVQARDGLAWVVAFLSEHTCVATEEEAVRTLVRVLAAIPEPRRTELAHQLTDAAHEAHGTVGPNGRAEGAEDRHLELAELAAREVLDALAAAHAVIPGGAA